MRFRVGDWVSFQGGFDTHEVIYVYNQEDEEYDVKQGPNEYGHHVGNIHRCVTLRSYKLLTEEERAKLL